MAYHAINFNCRDCVVFQKLSVSCNGSNKENTFNFQNIARRGMWVRLAGDFSKTFNFVPKTKNQKKQQHDRFVQLHCRRLESWTNGRFEDLSKTTEWDAFYKIIEKVEKLHFGKPWTKTSSVKSCVVVELLLWESGRVVGWPVTRDTIQRPLDVKTPPIGDVLHSPAAPIHAIYFNQSVSGQQRQQQQQ